MENKLWKIVRSIIITKPRQVSDLYKFNPRDNVSIEHNDIVELRLRKFNY